MILALTAFVAGCGSDKDNPSNGSSGQSGIDPLANPQKASQYAVTLCGTFYMGTDSNGIQAMYLKKDTQTYRIEGGNTFWQAVSTATTNQGCAYGNNQPGYSPTAGGQAFIAVDANFQ